MNASALSAADGSYDVVLEKGTLDSLQENLELFGAALREARRVLRRGGRFISLSNTQREELREGFGCQRFEGLVGEERLWMLLGR